MRQLDLTGKIVSVLTEKEANINHVNYLGRDGRVR